MIRALLPISAAVLVLAICLNNAAQADHPVAGCHQCHVPHNAFSDQSVPLWNPAQSMTTLNTYYGSPTMDATVGEVDGASKLCMSCHDGAGGPPLDQSHADQSLTGSHPVSFIYDSTLASTDGELVDPASDPQIAAVLDVNGKMQCTSCHDVHSTAEASPNLRWKYENAVDEGGVQLNNAAFCRKCHLK